jgi:3-hydroxybutyryl-CoA dehydrogenase
MQSIKTVCICGAGTMGNGIAQVCASAGYQTILYDVEEGILKKAKSTIENNLSRLVEKKRISLSQSQHILQQISFTSAINNCIADLIIEAIVEKYEPKISLFQQLLKINTQQTILASNTSSLSVTKIAESLTQPENLIGLHFFNPAPLMKLVEVIKTKYSDQELIKSVLSLANVLGKVPVICMDSPGFIVNRVARPFYIESLRLIEEEKINTETLDNLLEDRGFKIGPFKLMDVIGNDINYAVSSSVYEQLNKPARLKPSFIQKEKIEKGALGKKTGEGYYNYNANPE